MTERHAAPISSMNWEDLQRTKVWWETELVNAQRKRDELDDRILRMERTVLMLRQAEALLEKVDAALELARDAGGGGT